MMMTSNILSTLTYDNPCGRLLLGEIRGRLCLCDWVSRNRHDALVGRIARRFHAGVIVGTTPTISCATGQLDEYFSGERSEFDIELLMAGTDFQLKVWEALKQIPYGTTHSYGLLSRAIGRPTSIRAVANAVGANPLSIFVPCHRIIGADGSLTGYAGGLEAKRTLLALESGL